MRVPQEMLDSETGIRYSDPLGQHVLGKDFDRHWIAAAASVRAPSVPGVVYDPETEDTGLDVLVQSDYDKAITPVRQLGQRLLRNIVLMLAVVIIAGIGMWALALRAFREPRRSPLLPHGDKPTPLHYVSTLEAPPRP